MTVDIFHNHDGIVDQDADRKDQRKQRYAINREAPGPRGEQCQCQGDDDCSTDDRSFAPAHCEYDQHDYGRRGKDQLLNELHGLVVGGLAIVARNRVANVVRYEDATQLAESFNHLVRNAARVCTGLLGNGQRYRRRHDPRAKAYFCGRHACTK